MKPIKKVFLVIATLVLCLVLWGLFFNDGGVLQTGWNAMVKPVNTTWQGIVGDSSSKILPEFSETGAGQDTGSLDMDDNMGQ